MATTNENTYTSAPTLTTEQCDEYYQALLDRDPTYVGIFYAGVTTTSIFCIATCRARKPKRRNVEFFSTFAEALKSGYRPCKICKPTQNANQPPEPMRIAIDLVKNNPKEKISDANLRAHGISPDRLRRWFNKTYGITFHAYQRMYRINNAYKELKDGKSATQTAFENGYESLSGFGYTFKKVLGKSPSQREDAQVILIDRLTSPLGPMLVCATDRGVCLLEFTDRKMLEMEFRDLQKRLQAQIIAGENDHIRRLKIELADYFAGRRTEFTVPLHYPGTDFQISVWNTLCEIPYGTTCSYQDLATTLGNPNAVRAVARANGFNRIAILIPCHRVIGKDGKLTGYGGGLARKKWLLEHELAHKIG